MFMTDTKKSAEIQLQVLTWESCFRKNNIPINPLFNTNIPNRWMESLKKHKQILYAFFSLSEQHISKACAVVIWMEKKIIE